MHHEFCLYRQEKRSETYATQLHQRQHKNIDYYLTAYAGYQIFLKWLFTRCPI